MDDVFVYLRELPGKVNEMITPCEDGYTVYIDPRQSHDGLIRSYNHAVGHSQGDYEKTNVQEIEKDAHYK